MSSHVTEKYARGVCMTAYKLKNSHGKYVIIWHVFNLRSKCGTAACAGVARRLRRGSQKARHEGDKLICLEGDGTNKGAARNQCNFLQRGRGARDFRYTN